MTDTETKLADALRKLLAAKWCTHEYHVAATASIRALDAYDTARAQPASVPDCDHVWVEYVQPVYKNAMAGDVIRSGECGVKRYENLGFMCDKCGAVKPPAQPASVADGRDDAAWIRSFAIPSCNRPGTRLGLEAIAKKLESLAAPQPAKESE